jgi:hypothetical protein
MISSADALVMDPLTLISTLFVALIPIFLLRFFVRMYRSKRRHPELSREWKKFKIIDRRMVCHFFVTRIFPYFAHGLNFRSHQMQKDLSFLSPWEYRQPHCQSVPMSRSEVSTVKAKQTPKPHAHTHQHVLTKVRHAIFSPHGRVVFVRDV